MRCPNCGLAFYQNIPSHCPRCGEPLARQPQPPYGQGYGQQAPHSRSGGPRDRSARDYPDGYPPEYPEAYPEDDAPPYARGPSSGDGSGQRSNAQYPADYPPSRSQAGYPPSRSRSEYPPSAREDYYPPQQPRAQAGFPPAGYAPNSRQMYPPAAPPTTPFGAPYGMPHGMPQGFPAPNSRMGAAPTQQRKSRAGCIISAVVVGVLVVLVSAVGLLYAIGKASLRAQATTTPGPTVLYQNAMTSATDGWANDQHCFFGAGGYHVHGPYTCIAPVGDQADVDVKVQVTQLSGSTVEGYGIAFRVSKPSDPLAYYLFGVDSNGKWGFYACPPHVPNCTAISAFKADSAVHGGLNTANVLEVQAKGSHFTFFVNGTQVGVADDTTFSTGEVALAGVDSGEIVYRDLTIIRPL